MKPVLTVVELKIKRVSLGAEQTIIRLEEGRLKARARKARAKSRDLVVARLVASFWSLRAHRAELRAESRAAQLALAFLRGMPYAQVEAFAASPPPISRAEDVARKFGGVRFTDESWDLWEAAARKHADGFAHEAWKREGAKRARAAVRLATRERVAAAG